jgi:hypothetical protein
LRDDCGVSDADSSDPGVLGSLPRTRPQRPSARRAAAREDGRAQQPQQPKSASASRAKVKPTAGPAARAKRAGEPKPSAGAQRTAGPKRSVAERAAATETIAGAKRTGRTKPIAKAKRAAATETAAKAKRTGEPKPSAGGKRTAARKAAPKARPKPIRDAAVHAHPVAPKQGFEADGDFATGPVEPPSGTEIATSFVDLLGELAQTGLGSGGRLLKDAVNRLLRS